MTTFITNTGEQTLKQRIGQLIKYSEEFKFLVGFFYFSGISQLYKSLKEKKDINIKLLVGLGIDKTSYGLTEVADCSEKLSDYERFEQYLDSVGKSINSNEFDTEEFYEQVIFFIKLIEDDKLKIRKTLNPNHAKLYYFKIDEKLKDLKKSCFITGSSNLTHSGLETQNEFNVEISDYGTNEANDYFDNLWETSTPITENEEFKVKLLNLIKNKTLVTTPTPFEAFVLVLKIYLEAQEQKNVKKSVKELLSKNGYKTYKYQLDAVSQGLGMLDSYGGVIVADVVGLGKSIIASLIAKSLGKRGVIICPPGLIGDENKKSGWRKYREDFELYDWDIRSNGISNLKKTLKLVQDNDEYEVVIIDEAHRFRNEDTESHELLNNICINKKVILLTATPFNNTPADIFSLLRLFIIPGKSSITLENDLDSKFRIYNSMFRKLSYIKKHHSSSDSEKRDKSKSYYESIFGDDRVDINQVTTRSNYLSKNIRSVIEPVMIRRNRIDLRKDPVYSKEVYELSEIENPVESFFELTQKQSFFYDEIINKYFGEEGLFKGAIYRPYVYEEKMEAEEKIIGIKENFEYYSQTNLFDFMRRLLVKRFESSFGAFNKSINNFKNTNLKMLEFIKNTGGRFILDRKLVENIYQEDEELIEHELEKFEQRIGEGSYPKSYKIYDVNSFKFKKDFINDINSDIKMFEEILEKLDNLNLVDGDPKLEKLFKEVEKILIHKNNLSEPKRKVIIFSEYADTVKYLEDKLEARFPNRLLTVKNLDTSTANKVLLNFDASVDEQENTYDILLGTDKISEGLNLNRAGAIINYDIPWNPTRVIQRLGRINRIGNKLFNKLYIYNFFPTVQGATVVMSRQIASEKMFLIHNTLGEDAKIFDNQEEPTQAGLYTRLTSNPEDLEKETYLTKVRNMYFEIKDKYPDVIKRISELPQRVKVSKKYSGNSLFVFLVKQSGFYIRGIDDYKKGEILNFNIEDVISHIECDKNEARLPLSNNFWDNYTTIKNYKSETKIQTSEQSLERKAFYNLKSILRCEEDYKEILSFARILLDILIEYKTLTMYTLRRISKLKVISENIKDKDEVIKVINKIKNNLGEDYIVKIKSKTLGTEGEVIVAIENIK